MPLPLKATCQIPLSTIVWTSASILVVVFLVPYRLAGHVQFVFAIMDAFFAQAKALINATDETGRKEILDTLRDLSYSLESAQDSAQRILYLVWCSPRHNATCFC